VLAILGRPDASAVRKAHGPRGRSPITVDSDATTSSQVHRIHLSVAINISLHSYGFIAGERLTPIRRNDTVKRSANETIVFSRQPSIKPLKTGWSGQRSMSPEWVNGF
jgi:hypothetical protein